MVKNIFIPSFKSVEEGITFMGETEYNTLFSVGVNWDLWYDINGDEKTNIPEQRESAIISTLLPDDITVQSSDFENNKWYYDGEFIFMIL